MDKSTFLSNSSQSLCINRPKRYQRRSSRQLTITARASCQKFRNSNEFLVNAVYSVLFNTSVCGVFCIFCVYTWAWPTARPPGAWSQSDQTHPPPNLETFTFQATTNTFILYFSHQYINFVLVCFKMHEKFSYVHSRLLAS